jgi:hypothetical protein
MLACATAVQLHAMMFIPAPIWATWLAVHFRAVFHALGSSGMQPSLLGAVLWWAAQLAAPSCMLSYMSRAVACDATPLKHQGQKGCSTVEKLGLGCDSPSCVEGHMQATQLSEQGSEVDTHDLSSPTSTSQATPASPQSPSCGSPSQLSAQLCKRSLACVVSAMSEPNLCAAPAGASTHVSSPALSEGRGERDGHLDLGASFLPATTRDIGDMHRPMDAEQRGTLISNQAPAWVLQTARAISNDCDRRSPYMTLEWEDTSPDDDLSHVPAVTCC